MLEPTDSFQVVGRAHVPLVLLVVALAACNAPECAPTDFDEETNVETASNAPPTFMGRNNEYLGCIEVFAGESEIEAWDHGAIDGDIISLIANGETILSAAELFGPESKRLVRHRFPNGGFNHLILFAHNEGSISPNTASMAIDGSDFVLESDLLTNGYVDVVVLGHGVTCADSGPGGGTNETEGRVMFWIASDFGCGDLTVTVPGYGSAAITSYYPTAPSACGAAGTANFTLPPGTYGFSASCVDHQWSGTVTSTTGVCLRMELTE